MFSKFRLDNIMLADFEEYKKVGDKIYGQCQNEICRDLQNFIDEDGDIDGRMLQDNWFSTQTEYDVFLSHSHDDEETAVALAGFLHQELGLSTFIDSCLWGYSNDLLGKIDERYCRHSNGISFDYNKRNYSTSHVHMMLSIALSEMMDRCEAIFFLNTPNSISLGENIEKEQTSSPWIYNELSMSNIMRVRPIDDYRKDEMILEHCTYDIADAGLRIKYDVSDKLKDFVSLSADELKLYSDEWLKVKRVLKNALDWIYSRKKIVSIRRKTIKDTGDTEQ